MGFAGVRVALEQLRDGIVVVYSILVMATIIPGLHIIPTLAVVPYMLVVPGFYATLVLRETETFLETMFYAVAWSVGIFVSVYSIETLSAGYLPPIDLVVPVLTFVLVAYVRYRRPSSGQVIEQ